MVEVGVSMVLRDKFTSEAGQISNSFTKMMNEMNQWNRGFTMGPGNMLDQTKEMLKGMYSVYEYSAKVQDTIFMTSKIAGANAKEQSELMQLAQDINAITPMTAADIASGEKYLAMAGNSVEQIKDMIGPATKLASILNMDVGKKGGVADLMTNIMAMYVVPSKEAAKVTDDLYTAVTNANMSLPDLAKAITYAGADMANAGFDIRQTAAAIGVLGDMGIQGSSAGTALANMIRYLQLSLANQKQKGYNMLASLGLSPKDFFDAEGHLIRLDKIYRKFGEALQNQPLLERTKAFYNIFGVRGTRDISNQIRNMMQGSEKMAYILSQYDKNDGIVERVTKERLKTAQGIIDQFNSHLENLKVNIGATLGAVFNPILKTFSAIAQVVQYLSSNSAGAYLVKVFAWATVIATVKAGYMAIVGMYRILTVSAQVLKKTTDGQTVAATGVAAAMQKQLMAAAALEVHLMTILKLMREQQMIQMANQFGWINVGGTWKDKVGKTVKRPPLPKAKIPDIIAGTVIGSTLTKGAAKTAGSKAAGGVISSIGKALGMKGLLGRLGSVIGGPWGIALSFALPLLVDYVPKLIDAIKGNTEAHQLEKEVTTGDDYVIAKLTKAFEQAMKQKHGDSNINISVDGTHVQSVPYGQDADVSPLLQIGVVP